MREKKKSGKAESFCANFIAKNDSCGTELD